MGVLNRIALAYFFAGLLFCFFKPRALVAISVGHPRGLLGAHDVRADSRHPIDQEQPGAALAEKAGDEKTAALFKDESNPSAVKDSPAWAAAEKMFYATTNRVTGKFGQGLNLANHIDFEYLPGPQVRHVL